MKKTLVLLIAGLFCAISPMLAQKNVETVYLQNGSVIKGRIVEEIPNQSIKIRTNDGSLFVYKMSEVTKITREEEPEPSAEINKKVDFQVGTGFGINTKGGGGTFMTEIGIGKRFSPNVYWTFLSTGVYVPLGGGDCSIPFMTRLGIMFPTKSKITPSITFGGGGYILTTGYGDGGGMIEVVPGMLIPIGKRADLNVGVGYAHTFTEGANGGSVLIKAGFNLHKGPKREQKPTRDHGFQLTLEGGFVNPWGYTRDDGPNSTFAVNIVPTYKLNTHLRLGFGYGFAIYENFPYKEKDYGWWSYLMSYSHNVFLRGQFNLNDKRFSPFAAVDLGFKKYTGKEEDWDNDVYIKNTTWYVTPAIGASLRTTNNSYLDMRVGYQIGSKPLKGYDNVKTKSGCGLVISLGWTHTFKLGSNWFDKGKARSWGEDWVK